jgi:hypothetical protein
MAADDRTCLFRDRASMVETSYPVVWSEEGEPTVTGRLLPGAEALLLEGARDGRLVRRSLPYRDLGGVRIGRKAGDRLNGRPTLVVERSDGPEVRVLPLGPGLLLELAELVAELCETSAPLEQVAVVLPLQPGALETARELIAAGPPFDPTDMSLSQHVVFLTEGEVVFVFSGTDACASIRAIMRDTSVWPTAARWSGLLSGRPRLAEAGYAWPARA